MLIQRLLLEGDPAYEQEIFFTTRRGTRLLNMSDFRDSSRSNSWDYSAFIRTYALYLDEMLEFRMQGRRRKHNSCAYSCEEEEEQQQDITAWNTPVRELTFNQIMSRMHHLQQLLERFLATKPTGLFLLVSPSIWMHDNQDPKHKSKMPYRLDFDTIHCVCFT